jgi:hypothetical protein
MDRRGGSKRAVSPGWTGCSGLDGFTARNFAAIHERCFFIVSTNETPKRYQHMGETKVIEATENAQTYSVQNPPDAPIELITCLRRDIVPALNDYKVAQRLHARDQRRRNRHPRRFGKLTLSEGRFSFVIVEGEPLTEELVKRVNARLETFQRAIATGH